VNRAAGEDGRTDREPGMDSDAASRMWLQDKLTQLQKAKKEKSAFAPKLVPLPPSIFGGNISLELWDLVI
jgi:hypothetical protein